MKLLSIVVPSYNSQDYLKRCIDTLLPGGDLVEILIVNDGSTDQTSEIADEYARQYPNIVRAIHQENGGHGEAVNAGIRNATGLYFKVVDSDDWVNEEAYAKILKKLKEFSDTNTMLDLLISNYVYESVNKKHKKAIHYKHVLPENKVFSWDDIGRFKKGKYMLMHSCIYRTELLRECKLELPKHTFYVDNLFVYLPLPYVKKMYYLNVDFYRYFIGREDQSVNEAVFLKRIDQQLFVNRCMVETYVNLKNISPKLKRYMFEYLEIITTISSVILIRSQKDSDLKKKAELWAYIKKVDAKLYRRLRVGIMGQVMNLPGKSGRKIASISYTISRKIIGFN